MKKLKENVHAIQVGCQNCEGAHLDKECPLNEEVKGMVEVKYREFSQPFPNNKYDGIFNKGGYEQPSSGEKRPSLTEVINKYIEEASKRQAKQDEWLKKFYQRRANNKKFKERKTIYSENGLPLYTPFYYSPKEIEYFSANSGFSDNEEQETDDSGMAEIVAALEATQKKKRKEPKKIKQNVNYYVDRYEPPIPFSKRLEHHTEGALVHQTMESLKKIKINHPLLKEIRQTDNYAKQMKYLVEIKPRTEEDNEMRMNPKCFALLQNHLLPKEQDPGSFSLVPLGSIGKLKPINMLIEMADNTKCAPKGIVENLLIKINKFIFPVDFVILDMVEDISMPIILGIPLLATAHAQVDIFRKTISLEVGSEKEIFKMRSSFTTTNFESVHSIKSETFVEDENLMEIDYDLFYTILNLCIIPNEMYTKKLMWKMKISTPQGIGNIGCTGEILTAPQEQNGSMSPSKCMGNLVPISKFEGEEDNLEKYLEDPEEYEEDKANTMLGVIHDKLYNDWFNNTSEDEDDLEGILDYLKPRSYDGFVDLDDEAYNKRRCKLLGMTYEEPTPILIKKVKVTRYTVGPGETYTKVKVLGVEKIPRTRDNVAAMRARLIKK
ncbi:reverse transcriptase domain-containing protein [Tanacetum coccineum]